MSPAKRPSRSSGRKDAVPARIEGLLDGRGMRFAIVLSRFNEVVGERLLAGALDCLGRHGAEESTVARVPGSWEIPLAARALARSERYDGIVALGALIRGETSHFDVLAAEVAKGLAQVGLETGLPIGFGVLTTDTLEQALERAGAKAGNKGWDAALSALEMVSLLRRLA